MTQFNNLTSISLPDLHLATMAPEIKSLIFVLCLTAIAGLLIFVIVRRTPRLQDSWRNFLLALTSKREARLHKVVCYHCNRGMGLYNPVYLTIKGEAYIEGTCNLCGNFVRTPLR